MGLVACDPHTGGPVVSSIASSVTILIPNRDEPMLDETIQKLLPLGTRILISHDPKGHGVGWALRAGLEAVETPWVLFAMADGSENPTCLQHMLHEVGYAPAVWGDRWTIGSVEGYPWWKRILNRTGNWVISRLVSGGIYRDWTDLAKLYETDKLRQLTWSADFRCAVEIPIRYYRTYCTETHPIVVPMYWRERSAGRSAYRLSHALGCLKALWTVALYG